jgi:tight adherence protein C
LILASLLAALSGGAGFLALAGLGSEALRSRRRFARRSSGGHGRARPRLTLLRRLGRVLADAPPVRGMTSRQIGDLPGDLGARLTAAGEPAGLGPREWIALKGGCALFAGLFAALLGSGTPTRIAILLLVTSPVFGFMAPDVWLARLARRRAEAAARDLPDMLDLLRVTVDAGMAPARALGVVAAEFEGTLAYEWRRVAAAIALGVAHDEALDGLRARLPGDEMSSLVGLLRRARRHGTPLGQALSLQAARAREQRRARVREQAARAGPKIQLVVALLLVPAVILMVAAGLLAELQRSGLLLGT